MNYPIRLLILALVFLFLDFCKPEHSQKSVPKAVKGVLDLTQWNFEKDGAINLDGEWEFYWEELLEPFCINRHFDSAQCPDSFPEPSRREPKYIPVPSQWQNYGYPADGYATYRLRILLPDSNSNITNTNQSTTSEKAPFKISNSKLNIPLSIAMTDAGTACEMYINGKLASVYGKVGKSIEESEPFMQHRTLSIDSFLYGNEIEILVHVSNYHRIRSGLLDSIKIGFSLDMEKNAKQRFTLNIIAFSTLFIMGLYHLGLYVNRRKDISPFYFGIFCIVFAVRTISINERLILDTFPFLSFSLIHKLDRISFYYGTIVFIQFLGSLFPEEFSKRWSFGFMMILLPCTVSTFFLPMNFYARTLITVQITALVAILYAVKVLVFAAFRERLGAKLFLAGFALFAITVINDILKTMGILNTPFMASYGLLTFIIFQAAVLSRKFAGAFSESEKLAEELKAFSESLELKVIQRTEELEKQKHEAETERNKSEKLLLNILPKDVAKELKEKGVSEPVLFESVSVLFTDFKGFTTIAETLPPQKLVKELDQCFSYFDSLMERYGLEKLKTIGDSYMCAGGIPRKNTTHAIDCVLAALEIQSIMKQMKELKEMSGHPYWELRLGIHSGPLVAGVIGEKKFAYDVWGDTVNTASRMESSGTPGKINISGVTYSLVKDFFDCEFRGKVKAKNKGEIDMYYVNGLKLEYSKEGDKKTPNGIFWKEAYGR